MLVSREPQTRANSLLLHEGVNTIPPAANLFVFSRLPLAKPTLMNGHVSKSPLEE